MKSSVDMHNFLKSFGGTWLIYAVVLFINMFDIACLALGRQAIDMGVHLALVSGLRLFVRAKKAERERYPQR